MILSQCHGIYVINDAIDEKQYYFATSLDVVKRMIWLATYKNKTKSTYAI